MNDALLLLLPISLTVVVLSLSMIALLLTNRRSMRTFQRLLASKDELIAALENKAGAFENLANVRGKLADELKKHVELLKRITPGFLTIDGKCRGCGCTQNNACMTEDGPCYWVETDLCSACAPPIDSMTDMLFTTRTDLTGPLDEIRKFPEETA